MAEGVSVTRAGLRLACRRRTGRGPAIVFLPGYGSDMEGSKALALDEWAARSGRAMVRFDYAGCGASEGRFADGTLESWRDDALAVIEALAPGPLVLVGSSMGGWIALLVAKALAGQVTAVVGIAAAPDFTDWGYGDAEKATIAAEGRLLQPSLYTDEPTLTTRAFWESGQRQRLMGSGIPIDCPVRLLQGQNDPEVPWRLALDLAGALRSADVQTVLVKHGDHRLSRPQDIALLIATIEALPETP
ncbi:alpha/beta fold hydrolase [Sphingomonas quercus]|uniref:palmitoyl-protein hydrolase n=1 Tax=Sphingomonas quercus TaxID=2842451 RepID=A0ABS6BF02_9SPHN|nr:alpha/beta hydrolase [Sphingomonas quercus]MBU3076880.1 alpha/beta hydrolase [Sphingomonas quercus]